MGANYLADFRGLLAFVVLLEGGVAYGANNLADFGVFISFCCVVRGWCGCFGLTIWLILGAY